MAHRVLGVGWLPKRCGLVQFSSVTQSCPTLWLHGQQHARLPHQSPTPGACSCPLNWWCHPTISSSVVLFSSHLQSFPASGSFLMSQSFTSGGQSIEVSTSPMNIQDWCSLGWTGWISLHPRDSWKSSPTPQFRSIVSPALASTHDYWGNQSFDLGGLLLAMECLCFLNKLSRQLISFIPRGNHLLISGLLSWSALILAPKL